jgi:hypothetical protein
LGEASESSYAFYPAASKCSISVRFEGFKVLKSRSLSGLGFEVQQEAKRYAFTNHEGSWRDRDLALY